MVTCDIFQGNYDFASCLLNTNGQGTLGKLDSRTDCDPPIGNQQPGFSGGDLSELNFSNADFSNVNLGGPDLTAANLTQTNLEGANLTNTNLTKANLDHANLRRATVTGVTWSSTVYPDGTNSDKDGGTCAGHGV